MCEPIPSNKSGFYTLRLNDSYLGHGKQNGDLLKDNLCLHIDKQDDFKEFISDGHLLTTAINFKFKTLIRDMLSESEFWRNESYFELSNWNILGAKGSWVDPDKPHSTLFLSTTRKIGPQQAVYFSETISIDVVPSNHVNKWLPIEISSIHNVEDV